MPNQKVSIQSLQEDQNLTIENPFPGKYLVTDRLGKTSDILIDPRNGQILNICFNMVNQVIGDRDMDYILKFIAQNMCKTLTLGTVVVAEYKRKTVTDVKIGEKFTLVVGNGKVYQRIQPIGRCGTDLDIIEEATGFGVRFTANDLEVEIVN